LVIPNGYSP